MARPNANVSSFTPPSGFPPTAGFAIAVAILYFGRELVIPLAFALLISFLLSPAVKRLERWRVPRMPASLLVVALASAAVTIIGWLVMGELIQTARSLPQYTDNVRRKVQALEGQSRSVSRIVSSLEELGSDAETAASTPVSPATGATKRGLRRKSEPAPEPAAPAAAAPVVMPVRIVEQHTLVQVIRDYSGGVLRPIGTIGLIVVFTIFMLIDRDGLRNRLLRLMGQGKLQATTKAMDDAGQRVSRYVLMQSAVNVGFGTIIAAGLSLLGVPSSLLWGVLGTFLRFLPYVGPIIAWLLPFALTLAESDGWATPLSVTGLFFVTEMIIGNLVEPLLYGVHTGLSAVAIVFSAVFWTVLWGPVGLLLATPMTVCLSVLGRHSPQLEFLNIVLGDEPVLTPDAIFYQRLLALDQQDAMNVLENLGKGIPLIQLFDQVVIPALAMAQRDRHTGQLDARREDFVVQSINEFVTELTESEAVPVASRGARATRVFCIPGFGAADEIGSAMWAHFLGQEGFPTIAFPVTESPGELIQSLGGQADDVICISAAPPFSASHARKAAKNIREHGVDCLIVAGLWGITGVSEGAPSARLARLQKSLTATIASTLAEAVEQVKAADRRMAPREEPSGD